MTFTHVLNLSISASWLVLAVALARLVLKKAPKALHCALWALVAIRLLCPVSFESELSLIPSREVIPESYLAMQPADSEHDMPAKLEIVTNPIYEESVTIDTEASVDRFQHWDVFATVFWLAGMGAMALYAAYSYLSIRLRVRMAGWVSGDIWECDEIDSPFILGLLRPRIYLPSGLDDETKAHVLAHENAHLKRLDHIWKPLGFVLLTIHWFNPVMWLGYVLLCRDIELACDEKVIRQLDKPAVRAYSEALVLCSVSQRRIAMCPLAFGEVGIKGRIKSMLNYKKPGFWVIVIAVVLSIVVAVCFLTDPVEKPTSLDHIREEDGCTIVSQTPETMHIEIYKDFLPENVLNGKLHTFEEDELLLGRTDTTTIYLESARLYGNELMLTLNFRYEIVDSGEILLPYQIEDGGRVWTAEPPEDSAARIIQYGPDPAISVGIGMEVYEDAAEYITFDLYNMNRLTYRADHLVSAPTTSPQLEAIVKEDGYLITDIQEERMHIMFYTHWIPEDLFSETGYTFAEDELVLAQTETSRLRMDWAGLDGEDLRFDFSFAYDLPESGTILLPYYVTIKGINTTLELSPDQTHDYSRSYSEGVTLIHEKETETFSLLVDRELYEHLDDYLSVTLEGVYALTYVPRGMGIPYGDQLNVAEVLYSRPAHSLIGTSEFPESYIITDDLRLIACEPGTLWPIRRDLGELHNVTLDEAPLAAEWKDNNLRAWRCEAFDRVHLLLQQTDGSLYVAVLAELGSVLNDLFRLEDSGEPAPRNQEPTSRTFTLAVAGIFDLPYFQLDSDGTFQLCESYVSSYIGFGSYTLTEEELILKTDDGKYIWTFTVTDVGFAYDGSRSSGITYMRSARELAEVQDGQLFLSNYHQTYDPPPLDQSVEDAISAAILSAKGADSLHGSICAESHKILAELAVCGVATADGSEPLEELIVYLYAEFCERSTDGEMLYIEESKAFPAKLSFTMTESGYELTEYRELSEEEAEAEFPAFAWDDLELNRDVYRRELLKACEDKLKARLAALREQMAEAERLFGIVASEPLQYSDPGAYIDAHPEEWEQLLELGAATVHYSFRQLATGEEQGLRGYLMALASQEIIADWGEDCDVDSYYNGQNWFTLFALQADSSSPGRSWDETRKTHPGCALAIIHTEWQEYPPP